MLLNIKRFIFICIYVPLTTLVNAADVYQFLNLPVSSRQGALGGKNISLSGIEAASAFLNPASLTNASEGLMSLSMGNYLADIQYGTAMYTWCGTTGSWAVGMQYMDYGEFRNFDQYNQDLGTFTAKDMALSVIYNRPLSRNLHIGATFKPIFSSYERYSSFGLAVDLGLNYHLPEKYFYAGLVVRHLGSQLKGYYTDETGMVNETLPFDVQLGLSKKLQHAPFRFSVTLHHLHNWNLNYLDNLNSEKEYERIDITTDIKSLDMAFRHAVFGLEFLPGKNFYLAASYDHRRHQEMKMAGFKSMAGFSFGAGIKVNKFHVGFSTSQFQVNNVSYMFSVSTSLQEFKL